MLETYIRSRLKKKKILLMTHIVIGYPSFDASMKIVEEMVHAGVDLMELQIPFSEPIADGPVILKANQKALASGATVKKCMAFAKEAADTFDIPFLFMSYYNILFRYGVEKFAVAMDEFGVKGAIVPDLPPEEGSDYIACMKENRLSPIFIYSPSTSVERMKYIDQWADGFVYCVARKGVTGKKTDFSETMKPYLQTCRKATKLPLAVGFGVKEKSDVDFLKGVADIAVIGSQTIRLVDRYGVDAIKGFLKDLR